MKYLKCVLWIISLVMLHGAFASSTCHPVLWPDPTIFSHIPLEQKTAMVTDLRKRISSQLNQAPQAIAQLGSAGKISIDDPDLIASRAAIKESDRAAVLALLYVLTQDRIYFEKSRAILLQWAKVNHPTGNPIDETRLEGIVWAYDLIACQLQASEQKSIQSWLETLRLQKLNWKFGPVTTSNNHRIHQLKMLILLDKVLRHSTDWRAQIVAAKHYATINLDSTTGESIDYRQRDALHYQNFDLQAWLEINLISNCCSVATNKAFDFLMQHIQQHKIGGEFAHSSAKIDAERAQGGFAYAQTNGEFDVEEAAPTIVMYYNNNLLEPEQAFWSIVDAAKPSPWLSFLQARRLIWLARVH